jgi:two-component system, chemotaxis family, sensor kinase CheA
VLSSNGVSVTEDLAQDASLLQDFLTECGELLEQLDQDLVAMETSLSDTELLNRVFRAFHTTKGTSGFMGFQSVVALTHEAEDVLNLMRKGERKVSRRAIDVFLSVLDQLRRMFADIRQNIPHNYELGELLGRIRQLTQPEAPDRPMLGEILVADGTISHSERREALKESVENQQRLGDVLIEKNLVTPGQIRDALKKQAAISESKEETRTIRVDVNKLDEIVNLAGELVLERNRVAQLSRDFVARRFSEEQFESVLGESSARLGAITDELQNASLKARMLPIDVVFRRFPRLVRDLCNTLGKEVTLQIRGEDTELDKTIVEQIADPLVHLIRNSMDHGFEMPGAREAKGKPRKGTLKLEAHAEGEFILVEVGDDGGGIDTNRVAAKAVERGIVAQTRIREMSHREVLDLIFLPGFSTAEKVSDVSGRGVGMDVVRSNLKRLGGTVELESEFGRGSLVRLKLPLTLAILPVLIIKASSDTYALPLRSVVEILRVERESVHRSEKGEILRVRNQVIPLGRIAHVFNNEPSAEDDDRLRVVILSIADKKLGLVVDDFIGQEETIIRPLGSYLGHVPCVAGGTITGEGNIRLILDPAGLIEALESRGN